VYEWNTSVGHAVARGAATVSEGHSPNARVTRRQACSLLLFAGLAVGMVDEVVTMRAGGCLGVGAGEVYTHPRPQIVRSHVLDPGAWATRLGSGTVHRRGWLVLDLCVDQRGHPRGPTVGVDEYRSEEQRHRHGQERAERAE
jgi:hypothetical protein